MSGGAGPPCTLLAVLLTLSTTHQPAGDLGFLLHKHPGKLQSFDLAFGRAHVFYPELGEERCTAAVLLDIDPVALVRGRPGARDDQPSRTLDQYVNDRSYVASSMMSVAIAQVLGSALGGRCKDRPDLAAMPIPLVARIAAVSCRAGEPLIRRLFEPLGYTVGLTSRPLEARFPEWGLAPAFVLELAATVRLCDLLSHLYILLPVLDNDKHYWVGDDEVDKLLRRGEGWLGTHPERDLIVARSLKHRRDLLDQAMLRLREQDGESPESVEDDSPDDPREQAAEARLSLHRQRHNAIVRIIEQTGARTVLDLGCGEGKLLRDLLGVARLERIVGVDVSHRALRIAAERLRLDRLPEPRRRRIELLHGSLLYRDRRLESAGGEGDARAFDAAVLCEVIEHLDPPRLRAMERMVFEFARPRTVIVTTPNREYNALFENLPAGAMRHHDHRFEWSRAEFRSWAEATASRHGYRVVTGAVGEEHPEFGGPSQMAVFTRADQVEPESR